MRLNPFRTGLHHKGRTDEPVIYNLGFLVLFWTIFDSLLMYLAPVLMADRGLNTATIGIIIGSSSLFGMIFDLIVSNFFKNTHYRRIFWFMFIICLTYPFILWQSSGIGMFVFAMLVWGVYFDLFNYGVFDCVSRFSKPKERTAHFGFVQIARSMGFALTALVLSLIIFSSNSLKPFLYGWGFLGIALMGFLVLMFFTTKRFREKPLGQTEHKRTARIEWHLLRKISGRLWPLILITFYVFFLEANIWTLVPLYGLEMTESGQGELIMLAYTIPGLIAGWFIGSITRKFGKKQTALAGLFLGSLFLAGFTAIAALYHLGPLGLMFGAAFFLAWIMPSVNSIFLDYIAVSPVIESEVEVLGDIAYNLAFTLGPALGGILAAYIGISQTLSWFGGIGVLVALVLYLFAPKGFTKLQITKKDLV